MCIWIVKAFLKPSWSDSKVDLGSSINTMTIYRISRNSDAHVYARCLCPCLYPSSDPYP
jgi:hypothetical protein